MKIKNKSRPVPVLSKGKIKIFPLRLSRYTLDLTPKAFNVILSVKGQKPLINHMLNMVRLVVGKVTPNWVRLVVILLKRTSILHKMQGPAGYVKYLKGTCIIIQQVSSGYKIKDLATIGPRISRTHSGLPRLIPSGWRKRLLVDHELLKVILTILNLFRVAVYATNPKLTTITSVRLVSMAFEESISPLIIKAFHMLLGKKIDTSLKEPKLFMGLSSAAFSSARLGEYSTMPSIVIESMVGFIANPSLFASLTRMYDRFPGSDLNFLFNHTITAIGHMFGFGYKDDRKSHHIRPYNLIEMSHMGRIGLKQEAAGKVRVFAMVDPWTQWIMKALHSWIFSVLKRIPMDGTFDQLKPIQAFKGGTPVYSFDLSAATDRLPISFQKKILTFLFGKTFSDDWANLLVNRGYSYRYYEAPTFRKRKGDEIEGVVYYEVGQPMGALSSWGMLALTHHLIVQISAIRCGKSFFKDYALLGDDIII